MSQRKYSFVPGEFYHIYNRGIDKREIFVDASDYARFQSLLFVGNTDMSISLKDLYRQGVNPFELDVDNKLVSIGAYCLMPNHFHILATPLIDNGISIFMQKICTAYSMYFNRKYERSGSLFQGKFKSQLAAEDRYLKYLFSYIHLNPVKLIESDWKETGIRNRDRVEEYLRNYKYSSLAEMLGQQRSESVILDSASFPNYFENISKAEEEVRDWLSARGKASGRKSELFTIFQVE